MMKDNPAAYPNIATLISALYTDIQGGALSGTIKTDMLTAMGNLTTNSLTKVNVPASMAGTGGSQYAALTTGNGGGALQVTVYSGGSSQINQAYATLVATATGGTPPYHYTVDTFMNGTPPPGMIVDLNGYLTGTPSVSGSYTFGVCAVDLVGASSCSSSSMQVNAAPATTGGGTGGGTSGGTYYWANWSCGSSSQCASMMGASNGSTGPMCTLNDCNAWGNKYIAAGYTCGVTATHAKVTGTVSNGVCAQNGVDF